jgi:hypothetical protein
MACGLLMETAQTHQGLVDSALERLRAHTHGLDAVVREEIRRTLVEELQTLVNETGGAARALRALRHAANLRSAAWSVGIATLSSALALCMLFGAAHTLLPSRSEIAALTMQRDNLAAAVARLERQGGRVDLRRCGDSQRYCVRIDRKAPAFGQHGDYLIVAGY